jgi:hypothetical protein
MAGNWKTIAGVAVTAVIVSAFALGASEQNAMLWIGLSMMVGMAVAFFFRACRLAQPMRKPFVRRILRGIRTLRRLHAISPFVHLMHASAWSVGTLSVAATFSGHVKFGQTCMTVFFGLLAIAGVGDLVQRGSWLSRRIWSDMAGKIFSISIGTILIYLSIAKAKTWIHSITHIDPKYLTESTAILSAVLLPVAYGLFAVAMIYLLALLQLIALTVFTVAAMIAQQFGPFTGRGNYARLKLLWYRLSKGKKPLRGILPKSGLLDDISVFSRPLSTIAIVVAVSSASQTVTEYMPRLLPQAKSMLVALEYRNGSSCLGFEKEAAVVYMEDGNISVARLKGKAVDFSVETCKFKRDDA